MLFLHLKPHVHIQSEMKLYENNTIKTIIKSYLDIYYITIYNKTFIERITKTYSHLGYLFFFLFLLS